jgi:hypothetical protein
MLHFQLAVMQVMLQSDCTTNNPIAAMNAVIVGAAVVTGPVA